MHRWMLSILALSICVILSIMSWIGAIEATEAKAGIHAQEVAERMQKNAAAQLESAAGKARTFIDSDWMDHKSQYQTLVPPSEIDFKLERRLFETPGYKQCGRILLYLPHDFARNGHGSQLNNYLLAAMLATYLGRHGHGRPRRSRGRDELRERVAIRLPRGWLPRSRGVRQLPGGES